MVLTGLRERLREEMAARHRESLAEAQRETRRDLIRTAILCVCWVALGLFLILWSFHTTSLAYGRIAFFAGIGIGTGGWVFTMLGAYRRGEQRGDW